MTYEKILVNVEKHMNRNYDKQFAKAGEAIMWNPWVGKNYDQNRILILGMGTDNRDGPDWTQEYGRCATRTLVAWLNREDEEPFQYEQAPKHTQSFRHTGNMFINAIGDKQDNEDNRAVFWEAVAFNNFIQKTIEAGTQPKELKDSDIQRAMCALDFTIKIIKPKLVLVWGVGVFDRMLLINTYCGRKPLGSRCGAYPRVFSGDNAMPAVIGIQHPHQLVGANHQKEWVAFLCKNRVSKAPIKQLLHNLKDQLH